MSQAANHAPGRIVVISGPAGVGKGTVCKRLQQRWPELALSVSATTRPARPGEREGREYFFVSDEQFDELIETGGLLEWAEVHGSARYGTPRAAVNELVAQGRTVILEIEPQGARQVRAALSNLTTIFLTPPSWEELVNRLAGRGTETTAQQQRRLETARTELAAVQEFDYIVENRTVDQAADDIAALLGLA
ncbi:guanylate kinase [Parenemella sanctibonifatiensis]|uniref:Guanylate kinase n=1 Tax=Parenemella sanctibonifatiensis TaxID=2016505 RepID=A0A255E4J1_9ACTN|nr:guanylate kinase [Parenemella sanctibonifatiensis]OYN86507.1 guanylate kinase [Parenemella sanctibonifatiensis]